MGSIGHNPQQQQQQQPPVIRTPKGEFAYKVAWTSPNDGLSWRLNFGGCSVNNKTKMGGAGWILRDQNAAFKAASATPITDCSSPEMASLIALRDGVRDAIISHGVDFIEVEGSNLTIIRMILGSATVQTEEMAELMSECARFFRNFKGLRIRHVADYANIAANKFAAIGIHLIEPKSYVMPPSDDIVHDLNCDVIGRWVLFPFPNVN